MCEGTKVKHFANECFTAKLATLSDIAEINVKICNA